jgi:protoporphyrinogen oxidase
MDEQYDVAVVGAGFTGLTAALEFARASLRVILIEPDTQPGGLAGTFEFRNGVRVEKFYHHWFNNDVYVPELVRELGLDGQIVLHPSRTGMYFNGRMWKLSTPLDLFRFTPLSFVDRVRLGLLVLQVRRVKDWRSIEHLSIREWLEPLCGPTVYRIVWAPLIDSKFSIHADAVNAVWFWKKLVLRGSTRDKSGGEQLAYFKGGFGKLAQNMVLEIERLGGTIRYGSAVQRVRTSGDRLVGLDTSTGTVSARQFLFTPALPIVADIFDGAAEATWVSALRRVKYLGNMCLVLQLKHSLSATYWLNVNDPGFPFVGVIEHTNFDPPENYKGSHIAYLSRYLAVEDPVWSYSDESYLEFALGHLQRMFPEFERSWIIDFHVWRAEYAQPVTERNYSKYVPGRKTPFRNALISTMAQIYPEDRGTNYAIREGKSVAKESLIYSPSRLPV